MKMQIILIALLFVSISSSAAGKNHHLKTPMVKLTKEQKQKLYKKFIHQNRRVTNMELYVNHFFKYIPEKARKLSLKSIHEKRMKLGKVQAPEFKIKGDQLVMSHHSSKQTLAIELVGFFPTTLKLAGLEIKLNSDDNIETLAEKVKFAGKAQKSASFMERIEENIFPKAYALLPALGLPIIWMTGGGVAITTTDILALGGLSAWALGAFDEDINYQTETKKIINAVGRELAHDDDLKVKSINIRCRADGKVDYNRLEVNAENGESYVIYRASPPEYATKGRVKVSKFSTGSLVGQNSLLAEAPNKEYHDALKPVDYQSLGEIVDQCCEKKAECAEPLNKDKFKVDVLGGITFEGDEGTPGGLETLKGGVD